MCVYDEYCHKRFKVIPAYMYKCNRPKFVSYRCIINMDKSDTALQSSGVCQYHKNHVYGVCAATFHVPETERCRLFA